MASPIIAAGIPSIDGCPVLTRLKAFLVDQGVTATLQHVMRSRNGAVLNLSRWLGDSSASVSDSASATGQGAVKVRVKEWLGTGQSTVKNPQWLLDGYAHQASAGVIRATLPKSLVERAGIYEINWAIVDEEDTPLTVDRGILSVERSLFSLSDTVRLADLGPPTIQEIRMRLMDSGAAENNLLLDIEFKDEQILSVIVAPVRAWNESLPPLKTFTTRDFPFRGAWLTGILGQLHLMASNHYRRNRLAVQGGGMAIDDLNKEAEYQREGQRLWDEYMAWLHNKKVAINLKLYMGYYPSPYASLNGW